MATKISHIKLQVTVPEKPPQEMIDDYLKGCMESPEKGYQRLKEVIPDIDAVIEKILKPGLKSRAMFKRDAHTRTGMKFKDIPIPTRAELERQARKWRKKVAHAHRDGGKEYIAIIKKMAEIYGKRMLPTLAIRGYKDKIRGVGPVGARWLTGDKSVLPLILLREIIKAPPVDITKPGQAGRFRNKVNSQLVSDGSQIIDHDNHPSYIIDGNSEINRVLARYASGKFVPFTPGGASHVDFIVELSQLFLDIQVSVP